MVAAAESAGVSILGITDHNSIENVEAAVALSTPALLVLPGIEISAADSDVIGLFAPEALAELRDLARQDVLQLTDVGGGAMRSTRSTADLVAAIGSRGGLAILAHIDVRDGFLARANNAAKSDVLRQPHLSGLEITDKATATAFSSRDANPFGVQLASERRQLLGWRSPLARIMSSDAHSPEQVGLDSSSRTITRLRVDELNFAGVRAAIRTHPDSRCRLEADLAVHYPRLVRMRFEGGFLDSVTVDLSENLNCLIGGRGSGKSTALLALGALLGGDPDWELDGHPNMPDYTEVSYVDGLGTNRLAGRRRHDSTFDVAAPGTPLSLDFLELEQNFGAELQVEDLASPQATLEFLARFLPEDETEAAESQLLMDLGENGDVLRRTAGAPAKLKGLRQERVRLERMLATATDANLKLVAEYAGVLASEVPLLAELIRQLEDLPGSILPRPPDLQALAKQYNVDLTHEPASRFVPGPRGLAAVFEDLSSRIGSTEKVAQAELEDLVKPAKKIAERWAAQHARWATQIRSKGEQLKAAGFSLQVAELDKLSRDLASTDVDIRKYEEAESAYSTAVKVRTALVRELDALRKRRFDARGAASEELTNRVNAGATSVNVSVKWTREGIRIGFAERLGKWFELRSPRKERLASAVRPIELAAIAWDNDQVRLDGVRSGPETFFEDPAAALGTLRQFDKLFDLETMDLPDSAEIRVRFEGDPPGQLRTLRDLSLGQLRSVLLGFILQSPGNAPLLLDQPEDQLDGPFIAEVVVSYLHAVKEQRQLVIATHNANIVVLGDAELVVPLHATGATAIASNPGSVDNARTQSELVSLLEGGREAFERRADRYGFDL